MAPVPTTQSPTFAAERIRGLQIARVHTPQNGFGAAPSSTGRQYEKRRGIGVLLTNNSIVRLQSTQHPFGCLPQGLLLETCREVRRASIMARNASGDGASAA